MIGFETNVDTLDEALARTPVPKEPDLISIDVDGVDYHVWNSLKNYRPRVVVIEINDNVPNEIVFVQDRDMNLNEGSSLAAFIELGQSKGYELIAVCGSNAVFVVKEEFRKFGIFDNSIDAMKEDNNQYIFCCYNGKIYTTFSRLRWFGKNIKFNMDTLQILNEFRYAGRLQGNSFPPPATGAEVDLASAEGILREVFFLRGARPQLPVEEFKVRTAAAWSAAKEYLLINRNHLDGED